ncbi:MULTISPECIES: hypothetical protein [Enterobacter]|uniref:hypothetical protein n=1 Tax=Enterobacter TaxID=547 RepID=UPI000FEC0954|nr:MULTISPECIES: hypothetical protein [Enterobacter]MCR1300254.1 hypothetical protein [Enterobacter sp. FL1277]MCR1308236.1 hypothetical protein [Enterobacter sp. BT1271]MCR1324442.1 hypothetical protein [Enterobacter sp. BT1268]MCR1328394.1 hypothetical protein [Enterobacter sp. BT1131]RWS52644.1 hypothetical protein DN586_22545 [Enterobacter cloacae]
MTTKTFDMTCFGTGDVLTCSPSDKNRAKRIFTDLKKQGLKASEEATRQFAVNNGWAPVRAQELASFAKKYVG